MSDLVHGRASTYQHRGCRCADCKKANTESQKRANHRRHAELVAGRVHPEHGTYSTYCNYLCRCGDCRAAASTAQAAFAAARKAKAAQA